MLTSCRSLETLRLTNPPEEPTGQQRLGAVQDLRPTGTLAITTTSTSRRITRSPPRPQLIENLSDTSGSPHNPKPNHGTLYQIFYTHAPRAQQHLGVQSFH